MNNGKTQRMPSSFQSQKNPAMDPVSRIASVLHTYPSRPAAAAAILSGAHVYSNSSGIPFSRTLLWKTSLLQIDTHRSSSDESSLYFDLLPLRQHRDTFTNLITNIGIPWHLLPKDSIYYVPLHMDNNTRVNVEEDLANLNIDMSNKVNTKVKLKHETVSGSDDPLSSDSKRKSESDLDVLLMIIADVERLFPEHPQMFIESKEDKVQMIEILYRYAKWINDSREAEGKKQLGYVQGMHELCGVIYAVLKIELVDNKKKEDFAEKLAKNTLLDGGEDITDLSTDTSKNTNSDSGRTDSSVTDKINEKLEMQIREFLDKNFFAHDVFAMFKQLMSPIIDKYFTASGIVRESIVFDLKLHHLDPGDAKHPGLAAALKESQIESQLWLTRWFRMILTREVGLAYAVRVWDGLIAYACAGAMADTATNGHDVSALLPYVIILLILRVRSILLKSLVPCLKKAFDEENEIDDDTEALSLLLHYPSHNKASSFSRSASANSDSDSENERQPIMMYRKTRDKKNSINPHKSQLTKALEIPKLPSAVDLFSDAAHICGLTDSELTQIGPSLIEKYSNGDIYEALAVYDKNKPTAPFIDGVLKHTKAWRISTATNKETKIKSEKKVVPTALDSNRTRLELRLQERVQNRLRDRSHGSLSG